MIIFGTRRTVQQLAMLLLTCGVCGRTAANSLLEMVTKFSVFFIPLFPVRTRYAVQCTACGASGQVDKERAEQMQHSAPPAPPGFAGPAPELGQQAYPGQQPHPGEPR